MAEEYARRFYASSSWIKLRAALIQERGPICARCGRIVADSSQLIGHHKTPITPENINEPRITLNPENIELICSVCHNAEHERFGKRKAREVILIYGSPCSGKTTLANQLMERGDLIICMDRITQCISGRGNPRDKPDNLRFNAFRLRDALLDMVKTRYGQWRSAYIIGGYPRRQERERLTMELGAQIIYSEASQEVCLARAEAYGTFADEWKKYVRKWWEAYEA